MMEDEPAVVDLIVEDEGQQPIGVWSLIQRASKLDITRTQAQKMFKSREQPVIVGLSKPQAEALKVEFEALGATVRLGSADPAG
jgi:ribosomal protein L7/L12